MARHYKLIRQNLNIRSIFSTCSKPLNVCSGVIGVALLAFRAIGSFLSWVDKQDETQVDAWVDEEEFEEQK